MRGRHGCRFRLLLLSRRCGGARSRRSWRCILSARRLFQFWVSPASLVFRLTASENPQALRKVSLQAGLVERTYFLRAVAPGEAPGALGDPPGTFLFGDCFSSARARRRRFSARPCRRTARRPGRFHSKQVWWNGLISCSRCIGRSTSSSIRARRTRARFH